MLAKTLMNRGNFFADLNREQEAQLDYTSALDLHRQLAVDYPEDPGYRHDLALALTNQALNKAARQQMRFGSVRSDAAGEFLNLLREAEAGYRVALKSNPRNPDYRHNFSLNRVALSMVLLDTGNHVAVPSLVAEMVEHSAGTAAEYFDAAHFVSRAAVLAGKDEKLPAGKRAELVTQYADQAMGYLQEVAKIGFDTPLKLRIGVDPFLAPLRTRDDFKQLMADLKPKEVAPRPRPVQ
jgi:tetratricopeptide (TPR) repeat protein